MPSPARRQAKRLRLPARLPDATKAKLMLGWRRTNKLDCLSFIEEELTGPEAMALKAFIDWLKANPGKKTGHDYFDETWAEFAAERKTVPIDHSDYVAEQEGTAA